MLLLAFFSASRAVFPRPVCRIWWWFSCSSPSSSSLGGSVQVGSWWCRLAMKKKNRVLNYCVIFVLLFSENRVCRTLENLWAKPLWYQIYLSYEYFFMKLQANPSGSFPSALQLFLDSNLIYPSWWWGLSAVNMHPWTTCLPASASTMHMKWVLNWELFLLCWKCQSLLPAQLLEVYWQSCAHGSLSA